MTDEANLRSPDLCHESCRTIISLTVQCDSGSVQGFLRYPAGADELFEVEQASNPLPPRAGMSDGRFADAVSIHPSTLTAR